MAKKGNKTKVPERSTAEKVDYYKSINRNLRRRVDNLEKRMSEMEKRFNKVEENKVHHKPKEIQDTKEDFNKKFNPSYKEE